MSAEVSLLERVGERLRALLWDMEERMKGLEEELRRAEEALREAEKKASLQAGKALALLIEEAEDNLRGLSRRLKSTPSPLLVYTVHWVRESSSNLLHRVLTWRPGHMLLLFIIIALLAVSPMLLVAGILALTALAGVNIAASLAASYLERQVPARSLREAEILLDSWQHLQRLPRALSPGGEEALKSLCESLDGLDLALDHMFPELRSLRRTCIKLEDLDRGRVEDLLREADPRAHEMLKRARRGWEEAKRALEDLRHLHQHARALEEAVASEVEGRLARASQAYQRASTTLEGLDERVFKNQPGYEYLNPHTIGVDRARSLLETSSKLAEKRASGLPLGGLLPRAKDLLTEAQKTLGGRNLAYTQILEGQLQALSLPPSREEEAPASITRPQEPSGAHGLIEMLLSRPLEALTTFDPEGLEWFTTRLPPGLAPPGYEGEWRVALLGCGGWGCAYLAERRGERVVFKLPRVMSLSPRGPAGVPTINESLVKRVVEQASVIKRLRHPHLLRLLEFSPASPLVVLEYADGGTLDYQLLRGWRPSVEEVALVGAQLADALRYIHSRGLVHGDVKAGNVFISQGTVKLGDFSSLVHLLSLSTSASVMVTPGWRAPEQVYSDLRKRAHERGLENRADVYQLGNLLLYLLTGLTLDGEHALDERERSVALEHVSDPQFRRLLGQMLSPDPAGRPSAEQTALELAKIYWKKREGGHHVG